ncbi:hypothetical protein AB4Z52_34770 [Rhizobium sp. 2YAF20]|uniref:hypothetical protein n=1 Tax=Rhizobium sp. 2YAF20 TaxID=3233027 RepID=UPI003F98AD76
MRRRSFLASLCALPLVSCQGESATVRFKVIASATVDGRPVESSSVMEITYSKVTHSLIGTGGATRLDGEALIFDVGGKGTVYILPLEHPPHASPRQVYEDGILTTFGIDKGIGSLKENDLAILRDAKGRRPFRLYNTSRLPAFVAFGDEKNPKTIYEIDPCNLGAHFPGVKFTGLDIEITDEPVTKRLKQQLAWVNTPNSVIVFDRDPPGHLRPDRELPIGFLITQGDFFGDGSR